MEHDRPVELGDRTSQELGELGAGKKEKKTIRR
jgi:hypothetical protein